MPTVTFDSMIYEASPHLQGCPNPTLTAYYRKMATELCDFARVWRYVLAPITIVPGTYSYTLPAPYSYSEVICALGDADAFTAAGVKSKVSFAPYDEVLSLYPNWPDSASGSPRVYTRLEATKTALLAPVPDATTSTIRFRVALRPLSTATLWDEDLYNEYKRALLHGVLHELMSLPDRPWSNEKLSLYHGKQWAHYKHLARIRAGHDFTTSSRTVAMRPMA